MGKKIHKMTTDVRIRKLKRKQDRQLKKKRPRDDDAVVGDSSMEPRSKLVKPSASSAVIVPTKSKQVDKKETKRQQGLQLRLPAIPQKRIQALVGRMTYMPI
jgi:hypothetical protein